SDEPGRHHERPDHAADAQCGALAPERLACGLLRGAARTHDEVELKHRQRRPELRQHDLHVHDAASEAPLAVSSPHARGASSGRCARVSLAGYFASYAPRSGAAPLKGCPTSVPTSMAGLLAESRRKPGCPGVVLTKLGLVIFR